MNKTNRNFFQRSSHGAALSNLFFSAIFTIGSLAALGQTPATIQFAGFFNTVEENSGSATVTVFRGGDTASAVTVDYSTGKGSATPGVDYTARSGTLSFAARETSKTFSIPILDDALAEGSDVIELALSQPTGGAVLGNLSTARLFIIDNENRGTLLDGTLDVVIGLTDFVSSLIVLPDGKVIAAGTFARTAPAKPELVIRLNTNGSRDTSFTSLDGGTNSTVYALAMQSDGKMVIGGNFTQIGSTPRNRIARLNSNGSLDASFNPGLGISGTNSPGVYSIAIQNDGRILIGGSFDRVDGTSRTNIARLNTDGSVDTTFNPGAGVTSTDPNFSYSWLSTVTLQTDGKVLLGGQFTAVDGIGRVNIARLNPDGSVDSTFDPGPGAVGSLASVEAITVQSDGKIFIGGDFARVNDVNRKGIARLNPNGSVDTSFDPGRGVTDRNANGDDIVGLVSAIAIQTDGKVLLSGSFLLVDDINRHGLARLDANGALDGTFGPYFGTTYRNESGNEEMESVSAVALQPDGKILMSGRFVSADDSRTNRITRLLSANVRTSSFEFSTPSTSIGEISRAVTVKVIRRGDSPEAFTVDYASVNNTATAGIDYSPQNGTLRFGALEVEKTITVPILNDGSIEIDESFHLVLRNPGTGAALGSPSNHLVRIIDSRKPGNLDFGFAEVNIPFSADPTSYLPVSAIGIQADAKVVVAGYFGSVNGTDQAGLVRFNTDGTIDPAFVAQPPSNAPILDFLQMGVQPNGGIVGGFDGVYRVNSDGSLDPRFNPDVGLVTSLAVQTDSKVLISDEFFDSVANVTVDEVSRFQADGRFDISFNPAVLDDWVNSMVVQTDGKVVIGGYFTQVNGTPRNRIARLNVDGSLDTNFRITSGIQPATNAAAYVVALQPDGKILVGGDFTSVNGVSRKNLARLNSDGSVDVNFDPGGGPNNFVLSVAVQSNGKVLIGGGFTSVNGVARVGLARLNSNGSLDTDYDAKLTFSDAILISSMAIQNDGKLLIGGLFTKVNGAARSGLARLNGDGGVVQLSPGLLKPNAPFHLSFTSQPGKQYRIEASSDLTTWISLKTVTADAFMMDFDDPNIAASNQRFYRVVLIDP